jgi:hypothetical protein
MRRMVLPWQWGRYEDPPQKRLRKAAESGLEQGVGNIGYGFPLFNIVLLPKEYQFKIGDECVDHE